MTPSRLIASNGTIYKLPPRDIHFGASRKNTFPTRKKFKLAERHFTLIRVDDSFTLSATDPEAHPLFLNGKPVKAAPLKDGDKIRAGKLELVYRDTPPPVDAKAAAARQHHERRSRKPRHLPMPLYWGIAAVLIIGPVLAYATIQVCELTGLKKRRADDTGLVATFERLKEQSSHNPRILEPMLTGGASAGSMKPVPRLPGSAPTAVPLPKPAPPEPMKEDEPEDE